MLHKTPARSEVLKWSPNWSCFYLPHCSCRLIENLPVVERAINLSSVHIYVSAVKSETVPNPSNHMCAFWKLA